MAETLSTMLPLGTKAPNFSLLNIRTGNYEELQKLKSDKATVVFFTCNHCPYVKHILQKLLEVIKNYQNKSISFIAINSNDAEKYIADSPDKMREEAEVHGFTFPYLYDETQTVAKAYQAACTPDFFVFDKNLECVYRGRFDDSTPGNKNPVTGKDLSEALENILMGTPVKSDQKPSVGCNIKWKR